VNSPDSDSVVTLAVDAEGGDHGPTVLVPAALDALAGNDRLRILLAGRPEHVEPALEAALQEWNGPDPGARVELLPADGVIDSQARPVAILRRGRNSSLGRSLEAVANRRAHACVSAGNTVALVTLGLKLLGTLPGIRRPALMSQIPTTRGMTNMLDLGANLTVDARQLVQFALMGSLAHDGSGTEELPLVGLLNVGHEESKGHSVVREAHETLRKSSLNYAGFIEGHDLFAGRVDVAVCDGFSGNLVLKSSEGLGGLLLAELRRTLDGNLRTRIGAMLAGPALRRMLAHLDPAKHNGAPLLGLDGVVVKSHGRSDRAGTVQALEEAAREVERRVPKRIRAAIHQYEEEKLL